MDYSKSNIPEFICHKKVKAFKIYSIKQLVDFGAPLDSDQEKIFSLHGKNGVGVVDVSNEYFAKHKPLSGGYYVLYKDGYESYSPAEAFEDGYTLDGDDQQKPVSENTAMKSEFCHFLNLTLYSKNDLSDIILRLDKRIADMEEIIQDSKSREAP